MLNRIILVESLLDDIKESFVKYEKAKKEIGKAMVGYGLSAADSRESIKRRITVCREELLKIEKEL